MGRGTCGEGGSGSRGKPAQQGMITWRSVAPAFLVDVVLVFLVFLFVEIFPAIFAELIDLQVLVVLVLPVEILDVCGQIQLVAGFLGYSS